MNLETSVILAYIVVSIFEISVLLAIIWFLNRKANIAIKKADYIEKKLLELKYR